MQPYGVVVDEVFYYHDILRPWINATDPANRKKKRAFPFKRDPRDISIIYFFDPSREEYHPIPYRDITHPAISIWEPLRKVRAVTNSRGKYLMHLDTLPETMNLHKGESFGPFSPNELDRLRSSVFEEFGLANGRFTLHLQEWDQLYIAGNQGASRRFALWRRLTGEGPEVRIPAEVTPYRLNSELLRDLLYEYRAIGVKADVNLWSILREAGSVGVQRQLLIPFDDSYFSLRTTSTAINW